MEGNYSLENFSRSKLELPIKDSKLLLHSCCAPCAGEIMEAVAASNIDTTVYFYNPNIHPKEEYEIRKDENKRFCDTLGFNFIDADYDKDNWFTRNTNPSIILKEEGQKFVKENIEKINQKWELVNAEK